MTLLEDMMPPKKNDVEQLLGESITFTPGPWKAKPKNSAEFRTRAPGYGIC